MSFKAQTRLQVQEWERGSVKRLINQSPWVQFASNVEVTKTINNKSQTTEIVPDNLIIRKKAPKTGAYKCTVPWQNKINTMGVGGKQTLEGNEAVISMKAKDVHYNNQRQALGLEDDSIDGDFAEFYRLGSQQVPILETYFGELTDYNYARAILEGADEFLTESKYWENTSLNGVAPASKRLHELWLVNGATADVTWDNDYTTFETAIDDAIDGMTSSNIFDLQAANSVALQASRRLVPLGWNYSGMQVNWVCMLSDEAADQLTTGASNEWVNLFKDAAKRAEDNKAISGIIGVYKGVMYVANQRHPVWNLANAAGSKIVYRKPDVNSITRVVMGAAAAGTGTAELSMVMGKGAIGESKAFDLKYKSKKFDYDFNSGIAGSRKCGNERMYFQTGTTDQPTQESSFIYVTASTSQAY